MICENCRKGNKARCWGKIRGRTWCDNQHVTWVGQNPAVYVGGSDYSSYTYDTSSGTSSCDTGSADGGGVDASSC